ncbi:MAG: aquaporin family protein [Tannerellaceae bacterium]|nr:aquaporin family protein [Tannerellaceae bacterium]
MSPFIAELIGTMLLILLGVGVCANVCLNKTKGNGAGWMVVTTAWALGVFIGVVVAGPYSGAHLNPAVSIGLAIGGKFPWCDVCTYIVAQMTGAMLGAFLVWFVYKDHFDATEDAATKLGVFVTSAEINNPAINFATEVVGTFVLMFVVFYITGGEITWYDSDSTLPIGLGSVGAIPVAFTVWVIGLSLGGPTGYAINPARDLAPRVMHAILPIKGKGSSHWGYAWIPVLAPIAGAAIAAALYYSLK